MVSFENSRPPLLGSKVKSSRQEANESMDRMKSITSELRMDFFFGKISDLFELAKQNYKRE